MDSVPCRHVACGIRYGTEPSARQVDLLSYSASAGIGSRLGFRMTGISSKRSTCSRVSL